MKRFLSMLLLCTLPLVLTLGSATTYYYFGIHGQLSGDLGRLGAIPFGTAYTDSLTTPHLAENLVDQYTPDLIPHDTVCVTIGDSFSQQGRYGYQNFMAHALGHRIININSEAQPIQTAIELLNSGFFDSLRPRTVIVEVVERNLQPLLSNVDFTSDRTITQLLSYRSEGDEQLTTAALMKYTYNWLALQFQQSPVCQVQLSTPLFTLRPTTLYFYRDDLKLLEYNSKQLQAMHRSITTLDEIFAKQGIDFVLVVAVDKYDLYQSHILENPYNPKTLLDQLATVCDSTQLVNTKQLLQPLVDNGIRDIYYANDSHWTQSAAEIIGTHLARMCKKTPHTITALSTQVDLSHSEDSEDRI